MARVILTIPGPWSKPPALSTPFELRLVPPERAHLDEMAAVGRKLDALTDDEVGALRKATAVLECELEFDRPGDRAAAVATAKLCADALAAGGLACYVETSLRVFGPTSLQGAELDDAHTLFHLFVEEMVDTDTHEVVTEGMQVFDLADIVVTYDPREPETAEQAQAAAFSLAAQMVCDRFRPTAGGVFRASESAPWYRVAHRTADPAEVADDPFVNPRGLWALTPRAKG